MFTRTRHRLIVVMFIVSFASVALPLAPTGASAANFVQLTAINYTSCNPGSYVGTTLDYAVPPLGTMHRWSLSNPRAGTVTVDEFFYSGPDGGSGSYAVQVPAGTVAGDTLVIRIVVDAVGTELGSFAELTFNCTTGPVTNNTFILDYDPNYSVAPSAVPGPPVPEGYVLRTITCDVAVFSEPGGRPIGDNRLTPGQTWFVSPTATDDAGGLSWTQVFVSSFTHPWIPVSCVGDAPAGY